MPLTHTMTSRPLSSCQSPQLSTHTMTFVVTLLALTASTAWAKAVMAGGDHTQSNMEVPSNRRLTTQTTDSVDRQSGRQALSSVPSATDSGKRALSSTKDSLDLGTPGSTDAADVNSLDIDKGLKENGQPRTSTHPAGLHSVLTDSSHSDSIDQQRVALDTTLSESVDTRVTISEFVDARVVGSNSTGVRSADIQGFKDIENLDKQDDPGVPDDPHSPSDLDESDDPEAALARQAFIQELKAVMLQRIGLASRPPVQDAHAPSNASFTRDMRNKIRDLMGNMAPVEGDAGSDDQLESEEEREVIATLHSQGAPPTLRAQAAPISSQRPGNLTTLTFTPDLSHPADPYHELVIKSAILRMRIFQEKESLKSQLTPSSIERFNISVYAMQGGNSFPRPAKRLSSMFIEPLELSEHSDVIDVDVRSVVAEAAEQNEETGHFEPLSFGVVLHSASAPNPHPSAPRSAPANGAGVPSQITLTLDPKLQVVTRKRDLRHPRRRRDAGSSCSTDLCCRHRIWISIREIEWHDWIIAPQGFQAYYCKGRCPYRYKSATTFSKIKSFLHEKRPNSIPAAVCAPTGYSGLTMLYWVDKTKHDYASVTYNDMIVSGCRCF